MNREDPYDRPSGYLYECLECGARSWTDERVGTCADCGGELRNLAVPRE
jgi:predicted nucleic acid-binding Zn ribbon protein